MAFISLKPALLATVVALWSYDTEAFTAPMRATAPKMNTHLNSFFMNEDEKKEEAPAPAPAPVDEKSLDKVQLTSARKEVVFDDKAGRFYETNIDLADCIPDEEYCQVDRESGEMIRLTVAEKERIFIDALQVRKLDRVQTFVEVFIFLQLVQLHSTYVTY